MKRRIQRPLKNAPFCPISASYSKFNPRNIPYIPVVKFFVFLELEQKLTFFKGLIRITIIFLFTLLFISTIVSSPANAALWDKHYIVKRDQGKDILCDPYIVQENDWIYKIFRQKGEISEQDFPTFLEIFARLNPQIDDINRIYPGSLILIPLKIITQDTLPAHPSGSVIIPFASISNRPIKTILIRKGDTVSKLISQHFGNYGSKGYQEAIRLFQELNPQITDLNRVMVGQKVRLPLARSE